MSLTVILFQLPCLLRLIRVEFEADLLGVTLRSVHDLGQLIANVDVLRSKISFLVRAVLLVDRWSASFQLLERGLTAHSFL